MCLVLMWVHGRRSQGALLGQFRLSHLDVCVPTGRPSAQRIVGKNEGQEFPVLPPGWPLLTLGSY